MRQRDHDEYAAAYARLPGSTMSANSPHERDQLTDDVFAAAPDLAQAVLTDPFEGVWDARVPSLPEAWDWAATGAWILAQDTTDTNVLQAQIGVHRGPDPPRGRDPGRHPSLEPRRLTRAASPGRPEPT